MANLSELARGTAADDLVEVEIPAGKWVVELVSGKLSEELNSDKIGAYQQAYLPARLVRPLDGVDPDELQAFEEADGYNEGSLFHKEGPLYRRRDFIQLRNKLKAIGVPSKGRTIEEMLGEVGGQQAVIEVSYEVNENYLDEETGKPRVFQRTKLYALRDEE